MPCPGLESIESARIAFNSTGLDDAGLVELGFIESGSDQEAAPQSIDLQSHDPRPESVGMAEWAQGLTAPREAKELIRSNLCLSSYRLKPSIQLPCQ